MENISQHSLAVFLETLASKSATPGGGSVAALMGAQAAALISMVCQLTIGKAQYIAVESQMQQLLNAAEQLRTQLTAMIQADIDVFNQVMASYQLPKNNEMEQLQRSVAIQNALTAATEIPLECAALCLQAMQFSAIAAELGNRSVISDAGVAVMAAYSGLKSAALNVTVNANSLTDRNLAEAKMDQLNQLLNEAESLRINIYQTVQIKL